MNELPEFTFLADAEINTHGYIGTEAEIVFAPEIFIGEIWVRSGNTRTGNRTVRVSDFCSFRFVVINVRIRVYG